MFDFSHECSLDLFHKFKVAIAYNRQFIIVWLLPKRSLIHNPIFIRNGNFSENRARSAVQSIFGDLKVASAMHILAVIPARYASTRFPGKPLTPICGKPMIQHVYERTLRCPSLEKVVVATDDSRIMEVVKAFGGDCILTGAEHQSGTDRLAEAAGILALAEDDIVVNVQGDEPLLRPEMIEALIEALISSPDCEMSTLAFPGANEADFLDPNVAKVVVDGNGKALYFSRSPIPFPRDGRIGAPLFLKHLGFYAYRRWFLTRFTGLPTGKLERIEKLEQLRALENGFSIQVALSPGDSESVDTPEDVEKVLALLNCVE
jgi:3-deoxy-manno-octulosonate cytidylyltransferase (CMP-KDO synthetase)